MGFDVGAIWSAELSAIIVTDYFNSLANASSGNIALECIGKSFATAMRGSFGGGGLVFGVAWIFSGGGGGGVWVLSLLPFLVVLRFSWHFLFPEILSNWFSFKNKRFLLIKLRSQFTCDTQKRYWETSESLNILTIIAIEGESETVDGL